VVASELFGGDDGRRSQLTVDPARSRSKVGDLVLVAIRPSRRGGRAEIIRRIGRSDVARDVLEALMLDRGLAREFRDDVEREALDADGGSDPARRDLRSLPTFTIDPAGARDFDDAISAERVADGTVRVWVHIADVSAFVTPGSRIDREAQRRGTSVYVPGAVEPMLPAALSNEKCSLLPGAERLAVTVEMVLAGPRVVRAAFMRSVIRSDERLDYDRVDRIFDGAEQAREPWGAPLEAAREAARALGDERARRGGLEIAGSEPEFEFDRDGGVRSVRTPLQTESHRLIEHLMIAANEQVASALAQRGEPTLYRVHEEPDPERIERLVAQLVSLEVPTPPVPDHLSPSQAGRLVGEISQTVERYVRRRRRGRRAFGALILRSLKQAYYSPRNIGHAGLRSARYCHFTSPIRRYPDLVCHRALLAMIGAEAAAAPAGALGELAEWCSLREREAAEIERAADDVARCFLLEREDRDAVFEGEIVGLIGAGAFIAFGEGFEGMLAVRRLRGDWWELNEEGTMLQGSRAGSVIRLGDTERVRVRSIDAIRGRVDLDRVQEDR
jgi:ribonuclease R